MKMPVNMFHKLVSAKYSHPNWISEEYKMPLLSILIDLLISLVFYSEHIKKPTAGLKRYEVDTKYSNLNLDL